MRSITVAFNVHTCLADFAIDILLSVGADSVASIKFRYGIDRCRSGPLMSVYNVLATAESKRSRMVSNLEKTELSGHGFCCLN